MIDSVRCEVYNASYEPLSIVSGRRALVLYLKGKASILEEHASYTVNAGETHFPVPTRILLKEMVRSRPTTRVPAQLTQRNLFIRDKYTCQYCGRHRSKLKHSEFLTRDHVHPQDKGGKDIWTNVITACNKCNNKKANILLTECEMSLLKEPTVPTVFEIWSKANTKNARNN
jgi:5-methylcytosine-specific restriction endonuclease McrA